MHSFDDFLKKKPKTKKTISIPRWYRYGLSKNEQSKFEIEPLGVWAPTTKIFFWCLFCILGYSKHFIFSWKFSFFLVGIGWDWGILGSNNLMNWWDINPPFMYCVFHHISDRLQRQILSWQILHKKIGIGSDPLPPPLWDKITKLTQIFSADFQILSQRGGGGAETIPTFL